MLIQIASDCLVGLLTGFYYQLLAWVGLLSTWLLLLPTVYLACMWALASNNYLSEDYQLLSTRGFTAA